MPPSVDLRHGDCQAVLATLPDNSVHAVITDPPYELDFMGKRWDNTGIAYSVELWRECLRVLKPGGHLLSFGGSRTSHRVACAIEDAGFELRDTIMWIYGSGFPKGIDVAKAIDKAAGAAREVIGTRQGAGIGGPATLAQDVWTESMRGTQILSITAPATDAAVQWDGWNTSLKPAHEPIIVARKSFPGTVAANVVAHGTSALNIGGCRVDKPGGAALNMSAVGMPQDVTSRGAAGRWPANVVFSHTPDCAAACEPGCPVAELDTQSGMRPPGSFPARTGRREVSGGLDGYADPAGARSMGDSGGASRFFPTFRYQAKAPTSERPSYVKDGAPDHRTGNNFAGGIRVCNVCQNRTKPGNWIPGDERPWPGCGHDVWEWGTPKVQSGKVAHPTVKPLALIRWLARLVCPPGGVILDPFAGSGTTGEAALLEGFDAILVERETDYLPLIAARVERAATQPATLFPLDRRPS